MNNPEIKKYIDDVVRLSTDSSNLALTQITGYLQNSVKKIEEKIDSHRDEEILSREKYREEMMNSVKKTMIDSLEKKVNGNIGSIEKKLDIHIADVTPIIKEYKENNIAKEVFKKKIMTLIAIAAGVSAVLGAYYGIREFFGI